MDHTTVFFFLLNYLSTNSENQSESVRKHKSAKIRAYSESSHRADHEYLVSFDMDEAIVALLSNNFDEASKKVFPFQNVYITLLINTILANRI
jgi:predicted secreted acid phosphatase